MSLTLPHIALTVVCSLMASCLLHILLALADDLLIFITMLVRTASRFLLKSSITKRIGHSDSLQMMHDISATFKYVCPEVIVICVTVCHILMMEGRCSVLQYGMLPYIDEFQLSVVSGDATV